MSNKYLEKIAYTEPNVNYNVNSNYNHMNEMDHYQMNRNIMADHANDILLRRGYQPSLTGSSPDYAKAGVLEDLDFKADLRPREASANRWGALAGLGTGVGTMALAGAAKVNPIIAAVLGAGAGVAGFAGTKHMLYGSNPEEQKLDDEDVHANTNVLLEHLKNHY
jgi:hypothetical protein